MGWIDQVRGESWIVSHSGIVPDFGSFMALMPELNKGIVILFNANHAMMKVTFDELGMGAAQLLIGESPTSSILRSVPWVMRSLLLTLKLFRQRRGQDPTRQLSRSSVWRRYGLLPRLTLPMYGLLEVDVTLPRQIIAEHKARTGESLPFTGYLTCCVARAVEDHKAVQSYRKGHRQLVQFEQVDVGLMIERRDGEKHVLSGNVIRYAGHKTFR